MLVGGKKNQVTRDSVSSEPSTQIIVIPWTARVGLEVEPIEVTTETIGDSWIVGSSTNGIVGPNTNTQGGGQQVVGGSGRVETVEKVINVANKAIQRFNTTTFEDPSTTATGWGTGTVSFTVGQVATSLAVYKDNANVLTAILSVDDATNLSFELSADGGSNWESVTPQVLHTFTNVGNDLRFRATASGVAAISLLTVNYN